MTASGSGRTHRDRVVVPAIRYPESARTRRPPSPVLWTCRRCHREVLPVGAHTCDEHGRAIDRDGRTVTASAEECGGLFTRAGGREPTCGCEVDDLDHEQVEVTDR